MSGPLRDHDQLVPLLNAACDGLLNEEQFGELATLLDSDVSLRKLFTSHIQLLADMQLLGRAERARDCVLARVEATLPPPSTPPIAHLLSECQLPSRGAVGYFSSDWPMAYLIATLVTALGLLFSAYTNIAPPGPIAGPAIHDKQLPHPLTRDPEPLIVGRITGMVDCVWEGTESRVQGSGTGGQHSDLPSPGRRPEELVSGRGAGGERGLYLHSAIHLNDRFALRSGLMEITYNTGAKVILQGAATYEVESENGGFMPVGKLTGKVTTEAGRGLAIRTLTATVTDLGTEFGVETSRQSGTRVCVLQGQVSVRPSAGGSTREVLLKKGQSTQIDARGTVVEQSQDTKVEFEHFSKTFVRQLPQQQRAAFVSLTDLVAGGDGFGDRYHWGINPDDASVRLQIGYARKTKAASGTYNRYSGNRQIDGVFVPFGGSTPVQLDSAGHTFILPQSQMQYDQTSLWAYKGQPWTFPPVRKPTVEEAAAMKSSLCLHASSGITFDLAAIRELASGRNAVQFKSTVHNPQWDLHNQKKFKSSVWVFVDGQLKFSRHNLCRQDQPIDIDIPLQPIDRFLTLVGTDDGDGISFDHICLLEPRIFLEQSRSLDDADGPQRGHRNAVRGNAAKGPNP